MIAGRSMALMAAAVLVAFALPAGAGTPNDPELVDDCGLGNDADLPLTPWTDVCAAWVSVDSGTLTATVQLAADVAERPNPSSYRLSWTTDDGCEHSLGLGDRSLSDQVPEPPNTHIGGDEGYRSFAAICSIPPVCDEYGCYDRQWDVYQLLPAAVVVESGTTITFTITFTGDLAAVADQYERSRVLRGLRAETGLDCIVCSIYSDETAAGRSYLIP